MPTHAARPSWPQFSADCRQDQPLASMSEIFDYTGSLHRMGDDHELFQEMVGLLRTDGPRWLRVLSDARQSSDAATAERAAHTLKGLASNFGASRAIAAAAEVEQLARARQFEKMSAAVDELEAALEQLLAALASTPEMSQSGQIL
jgi:HPt (histidine-containing phosphotransfer) domain-containing protein